MTILPEEISCRDVQQRLADGQQFTLLDCREVDEQQLVSIEGAASLPMSQLAQRLRELDGKENEELIVYCHHGIRSAQVVSWLRQQGFTQAFSMAGGIDTWAREIDPGMTRY